MNRSLFFEDQVYDWGRFQKTNSHTGTNYPQVTPPPQLPLDGSTGIIQLIGY